jgi:TRAP-type C4-dicarboxylate transport system permease small subunit
MRVFLNSVLRVSNFMQTIAGVALTFMIFLTVADVVMRLFDKPIPGAVEIISICGGIVIGFTIPITSWMKGHIAVDFVTNALPKKLRSGVEIITRCVGIGLFLMISWNSFKIGRSFLRAQEVSGTLEIPLYPVVFGLVACFLMLAIVLFCDIIKVLGGDHE